MSAAFQLQVEDRPDYARVLDEAIHSAEIQELLREAAVNAGQLRIRALSAGSQIASNAATEYRAYVLLRRRTAGADAEGTPQALDSSRGRGVLGDLLPGLAVLMPILATIAAGIFLLMGHGLELASVQQDIASTLITTGWVCLSIGVVTGALGLYGMLRSAAGHRGAPLERDGRSMAAEVTLARDAWRTALRDRGILPFLRGQLRPPPADHDIPRQGTGVEQSTRHRPGYSSPDFSSPDFDSPA
jgi:hypothetical protein